MQKDLQKGETNMEMTFFMENRHDFVLEPLPQEKPQQPEECEYARNTETWD